MKRIFILLACSTVFMISCSSKNNDNIDDKINDIEAPVDDRTIEKLQELENKMDTLTIDSL